MTIQKAMNILYTLVNERSFSNEDPKVVAYNVIANYVSSDIDKQIDRNDLLFKLYIMCLSNNMDSYKTTIYDVLPVKELHKSIDKPINYHVSVFQDDLNSREQQLLFNKHKLSITHPLLISEETNKIELDLLLEIIKSEKERKILFGQYWSYNETEESLKSQFFKFMTDYDK